MMRAWAMGMLVALSACGPVVQIGSDRTPPVALYTVTAATGAAAGSGAQPVDPARAVTVATPDVPGTLRTLRIPVTVSDTQVQYVKAAVWAEQPGRLFGRLLADRLAGGGVAVIDARSTGRQADRLLSGQLLAFGADVSGDAPTVRVRYDSTLSGPDGVRQRRFEREVPVSRVDGATVAAALNLAANALAGDVTQWVAGAMPREDAAPR